MTTQSTITTKDLQDGKPQPGDCITIAGLITGRSVKQGKHGDCVKFTGTFAGQSTMTRDGKVKTIGPICSSAVYLPGIAESKVSSLPDGSEFKVDLRIKKDDKSAVGYVWTLETDANADAENPALRLLGVNGAAKSAAKK